MQVETVYLISEHFIFKEAILNALRRITAIPNVGTCRNELSPEHTLE
jgi:hypothetical protein